MTASKNDKLKKLKELLKFQSPEEKLVFDADVIQLDIMNEVQKYMNQKGINRKELADLLGKSKSFISQLFSADKKLHLGLIAQFQDIFQAKFTLSFKPYAEFKPANKDDYTIKSDEKYPLIFNINTPINSKAA